MRLLISCVGGEFSAALLHRLRSCDQVTAIVAVNAMAEQSVMPFVDVFCTVPNATFEPEAFLIELAKIIETHDVDALILLSEAEIQAFASNEKISAPIAEKCSCASNYLAPYVGFDKFDFFDAIGYVSDPSRGISIVKSLRELSSHDLYGEKLVLKPAQGTGSRGVVLLDPDFIGSEILVPDRDCYRLGYDCIGAFIKNNPEFFEGLELIVMPYISGKTFDVDCVVDQGEILALVPRRRTYHCEFSPVNQGCVIEPNTLVFDEIAKAAKKLRLHGVCDFDVIVDDANRATLIDVGYRFSGSIIASFHSDVDPVGVAVKLMSGDLESSQNNYPTTPSRSVELRPAKTFLEM